MPEIAVFEQYKSALNSRRAANTIRRLLSTVPEDHLIGIESVVLTDRASLDGKKVVRHGRATIAENECHSFYHLATRERKAWVEIIVDNVFAHRSPALLRLTVYRERLLAQALFHEVAHHIQNRTKGSRPDEAAAERSAVDMWSRFFRTRHRLLVPVARLLLWFAGIGHRPRTASS